MSYLKAIGIGALAGMRSMAAPALVSHHLANAGGEANAALPCFLAGASVASGLKALAAGEMLADKTPWIPDRISTIALLYRSITAIASVARQRRLSSQPTISRVQQSMTAFR